MQRSLTSVSVRTTPDGSLLWAELKKRLESKKKKKKYKNQKVFFLLQQYCGIFKKNRSLECVFMEI